MSQRVTDSLLRGVSPRDVTRSESTLPLASPREAERISFREIYEAHVEMVFRTLRRSGVAASSVDDVAQEVFLAVHRALPGWEPRVSTKAWVYRIARNAALNHKRCLARRPDREVTDLADELGHLGTDPESHAADREAVDELARILATLPPSQSEVLVLMELEGFTAGEVSELLATPLNTIYSRLRLGRAALEAALEERAEAAT